MQSYILSWLNAFDPPYAPLIALLAILAIILIISLAVHSCFFASLCT